MNDDAQPPELRDRCSDSDLSENRQARADADEQETITHYLRLRAAWSPCWGAGAMTRPGQTTR